ncbi:MAG TPA: glutathione S-transferase family protein [Candidatus Limnocylindrales bacterium]|nr:glutathione S-transferase family protein [Candidatus Limnocylindrales bacterium]
MPEIIFHQYAMSPFSEKIRKVFAHKKLTYREVDQPAWMPKPHLTPLTGGYRRIPVMQIGADIYCDSALIARKIEAVAPDPSIYIDGNAAAGEAAALWADKLLFFAMVPLVFTALSDVLPPELFEDRRKMFPQMSIETFRAAVPGARGALQSACANLETTLSRMRYVLGDRFSIADAAVFHTFWFVRNDPVAREIIYSRPSLADWMQRIEAMGLGNAVPMSGEEAMAAARDSEPQDIGECVTDDPTGVALGTTIGISSDDLPQDVFVGRLAALGEHEIVLAREDPQVGRVAVHFPRTGYYMRPAGNGTH